MTNKEILESAYTELVTLNKLAKKQAWVIHDNTLFRAWVLAMLPSIKYIIADGIEDETSRDGANENVVALAKAIIEGHIKQQ